MEQSPPREITLKQQVAPQTGAAFPAAGCNVELTRIHNQKGKTFWSLGFEAFGELACVENALRSTIDVMQVRKPPHLLPGYNASYPKWLSEITLATTKGD